MFDSGESESFQQETIKRQKSTNLESMKKSFKIFGTATIKSKSICVAVNSFFYIKNI